MACPKLKIPWPRWANEPKPNPEQEHENYQAIERWGRELLKCIPAASAGTAIEWASFTNVITLSTSEGSSVLNTIGVWDIEYRSSEAFDIPDVGGDAWIIVPQGVYQWTLEVWLPTGGDGLINFDTPEPTLGTTCAWMHVEVIEGSLGGFSKLQYYEEPVGAYDLEDQILLLSGTVAFDDQPVEDNIFANQLYVEAYLHPADWLTALSAGGDIGLHLTLFKLGDPIPYSPPE